MVVSIGFSGWCFLGLVFVIKILGLLKCCGVGFLFVACESVRLFNYLLSPFYLT